MYCAHIATFHNYTDGELFVATFPTGWKVSREVIKSTKVPSKGIATTSMTSLEGCFMAFLIKSLSGSAKNKSEFVFVEKSDRCNSDIDLYINYNLQQQIFDIRSSAIGS